MKDQNWTHMRLRLPDRVRGWLIDEARKNGASQNSEVVRTIVERRERVLAERQRLSVSTVQAGKRAYE